MEKTEVKGPKIKKVFICSPFRPRGKEEEERRKEWSTNIDRAQAACRFAIRKGYVVQQP